MKTTTSTCKTWGGGGQREAARESVEMWLDMGPRGCQLEGVTGNAAAGAMKGWAHMHTRISAATHQDGHNGKGVQAPEQGPKQG